VISISPIGRRAGRPLTIFGDGGQTRDFGYVATSSARSSRRSATREPRRR